MMSKRFFLPLLCGLTVLAACSGDLPTGPADHVADLAKSGQAPLLSPPQIIVNNFVVQYDGRTVADDETTFRYTVFGTGVNPSLSYFALELPACAPALAGYEPVQAATIGIDPQTGIYGIKWDLPIDANDLQGREYVITFPGDVPEGVIRSTVKAGSTAGLGVVPGPCGGYLISGTVFVDANADGWRGFNELGIADVVVELLEGGVVVGAVATDAQGYFQFLRADGTYELRIDPAGHPEAFNPLLLESFDPTTPLQVAVTVGPDALDNDFGFAPRTEEIILELENGELLSDGRTVKFWTQELRRALNSNNGRGVYDRDTLLGFLAAIQELALEDVFQFTPGNELREAYDILRSKSRDPLDVLTRELLATEFNEVSGQGLIGDAAPLQGVLIAWGEALIAENRAGLQRVVIGVSDDGLVILASDQQIGDASRLFAMINTGGGGGVDE
jgi:hypothetical protein